MFHGGSEQASLRCASSGKDRHEGERRDIDHKGEWQFQYLDIWQERCTCGLVGCSKRRDVHVRGRLSAGQREQQTHCLRVCAPVAWLDAPKDETYTFEVDCRLVKGSNKLIAFVSVYDGPDGANNFPLTFGPRTWGGDGVGFE